MTTQELFLNFLGQYRKPFDAEVAASLINAPMDEIQNEIEALMERGEIKQIEPGIYIMAGHRDRTNTNYLRNKKGGTQIWSYSTKSALMLMELIERKRYTSVRKLAKDAGYSRQWVYTYLASLCTIGCVGCDRDGYYVISRAMIGDLGRVEKGILSRLRAEANVIVPNIGRPRGHK